MKFEIKNRFSGSVLFSIETDSWKLAVEAAIKSSANLRSADLSSADLRSADLRYADLRSADLSSADLRSADLRSADLSSADLSSADLRSANLSSADLSSADLRSADLRSADLSYADLRSAKELSALTSAQISIVPEHGSFVGWKKCQAGVLVKICISSKARRSNATGRKCRAEYVKVLEVIGADHGISSHDGKTIYRTGEIVRCDKWDEDRFIECGGGIHFFLTKIEAENF